VDAVEAAAGHWGLSMPPHRTSLRRAQVNRGRDHPETDMKHLKALAENIKGLCSHSRGFLQPNFRGDRRRFAIVWGLNSFDFSGKLY
jgi:hypothetical protein